MTLDERCPPPQIRGLVDAREIVAAAVDSEDQAVAGAIAVV